MTSTSAIESVQRVQAWYGDHRHDRPYCVLGTTPHITPQAPNTTRPQDLLGDASPTLSTASTVSSQGVNTESSVCSVGSSSSSVTVAPPGHVIPEAGMAQPINAYDLPCEFYPLRCDRRFDAEDVEAWIAHTIDHFREPGPPSFAICTFCDDPDDSRFRSHGDNVSMWRARMMHIQGHFQALEGEGLLRPDWYVIDYMYSRRLLSERDYRLAKRYTERPYVEGRVAPGFQTEEMCQRSKKQNNYVYDDNRQRRKHNSQKQSREGPSKSTSDP